MFTYKRPQFIGKAIQSILAQQFQEWELLVVHDGPNEEIPVVMEEWQKRDSRIHSGASSPATSRKPPTSDWPTRAANTSPSWMTTIIGRARTSSRYERTSWTGAPTTAAAGAASL